MKSQETITKWYNLVTSYKLYWKSQHSFAKKTLACNARIVNLIQISPATKNEKNKNIIVYIPSKKGA